MARTIITVGDPERVRAVSRRFDRVELRVEAREFVTHTGELDGRRLTVMSTGIGTDNVDIVLNELDALFNVDLQRRQVRDRITALTLLRLGTSGAFQPDLPLGSLLLSGGALAADGLLPFYPAAGGADPAGDNLTEWLAEAAVAFPVPLRVVRPTLPKALAESDLPQGLTLTAAGFYAPQGRSLRLFSALTPGLLERLRGWRFQDERLTNIEMETAGIYGLATALGHRAASVSALLANRAAGTFADDPAGAVSRLIDRGLALAVAADRAKAGER